MIRPQGTGKAIIALAHKFPGIGYRTLKNKWPFQDFPNFVLAEDAAASLSSISGGSMPQWYEAT